MKLLTNQQICEDLLGWKKELIIYDMFKWLTPDGVVFETPEFDDSLDDCFDYIVPMLNEKRYKVLIETGVDGDTGALTSSIAIIKIYDINQDWFENEKPAPAFIEALSKWWEDQST